MGLKINWQYCPQCRQPLERDTEEQPHCAACNITIYHNVVGGAAVAIVRDGRVLVSRRAIDPYKGSYDLIGGFMKPGETPEQTAIREAQEESGLIVAITGLLGIYSDQYGEGAHTLGIHYIGHIVEGTEHPGDDAASLEWLDIANLPAEATQTGFKNARESLRDLQIWYKSQN